ncbi:MAG: ATP-dependent helicase [Thermotogota bacterium]|nr:ATP-dependent helicase [Thermotogota bacterium]
MSWDEGVEGQQCLEIAKTDATPLRVMAGPGTGKTFALMRRIVRLLEESADPSRFLLVTFTRTIANDLVRELSELNVQGSEDINAGTLHSFCFSTLNRESVLEITGRNPRPLLEYEVRFLKEDIKQIGLGGIRELDKKIKAFEAAWARLQSDEPGWPQDEEDRKFQQALYDWLVFHEAMLVGELVPETLRYLRGNPTCTERNKFDYVFVDEYQDLNKAELKLIDLLSENASFMLIGDENQSIYESFRFAHPEGIASYANNRPETHDIPLNECRRCPKKIVELANRLIQINELRIHPTILNYREENRDGEVHVVQWETMEVEANGLTNFIKNKIDDGTINVGKILVLCPRRQFGYLIRDKLRDIGINAQSFFHEELLEGNPTNKEENKAQEALTILTLLSNPTDRVALRCWLGFGSSTLGTGPYQRIRSYCEENGDTPKDVFEKMSNGELKMPYTHNLIERCSILKQKIEELDGIRGCKLVDQLFPIDNDWSEPFRLILNDIKEDATPSYILEELKTNITQPEMPTEVDYVRVMSLHKSKGLTADLVVICGCIDGFIPFRDDGLYGAELKRNLEEQRRLFYVGITRTTNILVISSVLKLPRDLAYKMGARVKDNNWRYAKTISSPFILEFGPDLPLPIMGQDWIY